MAASSPPSGCPMHAALPAPPPSASPPSGCPMHAARPAKADEINPANAMPTQPNQQPAMGQRAPLSTRRVDSTIPGPSEGNWQYPSQQMFFNAMRRKGYDPAEHEMRAVVAIHNTVNEKAWDQILHWESLHPECLDTLRLLRFQQKQEQTPKAQAFEFVGYKPPFDRHDWVVDRCGVEVRYLIDFYRGRPPKGIPESMTPMYLDARPAADDVSGAWDRARMPFVEAFRAARQMVAPMMAGGSAAAATSAAEAKPAAEKSQ